MKCTGPIIRSTIAAITPRPSVIAEPPGGGQSATAFDWPGYGLKDPRRARRRAQAREWVPLPGGEPRPDQDDPHAAGHEDRDEAFARFFAPAAMPFRHRVAGKWTRTAAWPAAAPSLRSTGYTGRRWRPFCW